MTNAMGHSGGCKTCPPTVGCSVKSLFADRNMKSTVETIEKKMTGTVEAIFAAVKEDKWEPAIAKKKELWDMFLSESARFPGGTKAFIAYFDNIVKNHTVGNSPANIEAGELARDFIFTID